MTCVVTYIEVRPDALDRAAVLLGQYSVAARSSHGNSYVQGLQEIGRQNRFVLVESWNDEESYMRQESADTTTHFRAAVRAIQNGPYDQRVHHAFDVSDSAMTMPDALVVVTHVDVPPPRREETEALLRKLAGDSRKDTGNAGYDVFQQNAPRLNHFTVFAKWQHDDSFVSYQLQAHTREFREALGPMLGAPYDERLYRPLH